MSETVTLRVPDMVVRQARAVANQTQRPFEDVLLDWLGRSAADVPVELLADDEVLALRDQVLTKSDQDVLSTLLERQREGELSGNERLQLDELMVTYRRGMVRKAQALKVAVERGLQPALGSAS